jgi:hypothetical protein
MLAAKAVSAERPSPLIAPLLFAGAAAVVVALHLATNGTLGFHTDELYYLDAGRHPAFGYVDFPPLVPLLARLETSIFGVTPWALRVLPTLLGGIMVALSGAYVRKLGGSLAMQALALLVAVTAPYFLGSNWVYQTVTFDECTWMVSLYWFVCVVMDRRPRHWIYLGLSLGVGLEVKFTILALIAAIGVAMLVTPSLRAALRTRYPWIAAAIALGIWAPNLAWQVAEGFPTVTYVAHHSGSGGGLLDNALLIVVYLFFLLPLWSAGLVSLLRSPELRPVGIACVLPLVLYLFVGKSYYAVGTVPIAIAQGLMAISRVRRPRLRTGLDVAVVIASLLQLVVFAQLTLPITPPSRIHALGLDTQNELFADSVGWDDVAHQVTAAYEGLPVSERQSTAIISAYYGVPGALQVYGGPKEHPVVVSPQLSDWYWLPQHVNATGALMIDYAPKDVTWMCDSPSLLTRLIVPYGVRGLEQGAPITLCPLRISIAAAWPRLKNFS